MNGWLASAKVSHYGSMSFDNFVDFQVAKQDDSKWCYDNENGKGYCIGYTATEQEMADAFSNLILVLGPAKDRSKSQHKRYQPSNSQHSQCVRVCVDPVVLSAFHDLEISIHADCAQRKQRSGTKKYG